MITTNLGDCVAPAFMGASFGAWHVPGTCLAFLLSISSWLLRPGVPRFAQAVPRTCNCCPCNCCHASLRQCEWLRSLVAMHFKKLLEKRASLKRLFLDSAFATLRSGSAMHLQLWEAVVQLRKRRICYAKTITFGGVSPPRSCNFTLYAKMRPQGLP